MKTGGMKNGDRTKAEPLTGVLGAVCRNVVDGVILFDPDGVVRNANEPAVEHLGFDPTGWEREDLERALQMLDESGAPVPPERSPVLLAQRGEDTKDVHVEIRLPDGSRRWLGASVSGVHEDGLARVVLITRDITERMTLVGRLRRSEQSLRSVLERVTDGFVALDEQGRVEYINEVAEEMLQRRRDDVVQRSAWEALRPSSGGDLIDGWARALREQTPVTVEEYLPAPAIWVEARAFPGPDGLTAYLTDVSERHREQARLQRMRQLDEALGRINEAIDSALDFDSIMRSAVGIAADAVGADTAGVVLREGDRWLAKYVIGLPDISDFAVPHTLDRRLESLAASERTLIADPRVDPVLRREVADRLGIRSIAAMRLEVHGEFAGALGFGFSEAPIEIGPERRWFIERLSAVVALGLENARLLSAEREVAETLQSALLPTHEHVQGIRLGTLYRAAKDHGRVGGDFYDVFETHDKVAFIIGDVSGKGLKAAAATSLVKNVLRAYIEEGHPPATAVTHTNNVVLAGTEPEMFATLFVGLLDPVTGDLVYCSGGHPQPVVMRGDGHVAMLETRSSLVGAIEGASFAEEHCRLESADVLLLYTDGVTEARCRDGMLGEDGLQAFLQGIRHADAEQLPDLVYAFIDECTEGLLSDDVAMLAVSLER